jgi:hypothetical protein
MVMTTERRQQRGARQPSELREEEAIQMAITQSELDELAKWQGLAIQLWEYVQAHEGLSHRRPH